MLLLSTASTRTTAQENSPYSRYGLGDLLPGQNILNRGMGGLSAAFADYSTVNFANPASYSELKITTLDIGLDYSSRTLRTLNPPRKFASSYLIPSYLQLGLPLSKKGNWGMNIGLRPVTRINYDIIVRTKLPNLDSIRYSYFGQGGTYQAYWGMGFGSKALRVGFNVGYMFGNKEYSTKVAFINDTLDYKMSNSSDTTRFGGLFYNLGIQYRIKLGEKTILRLAANGNANTTLNAVRNISRETVRYTSNTGYTKLDSVYTGAEEKGTIIHPSSWAAGFMLEKEARWMFGLEYSKTKWSNYRYYGTVDKVQDIWAFRMGGQFIPDYKAENYWKRVVYRVGASFGTDYVKLSKSLPQYTLSFGAGLPVRRNVYTNQYTTINTSFEMGFRGNKDNELRENLFRLSLGLNLSDIWFNKPKYQ